ncbi:MAG: Lipid-A-disaccharide synthase [Syntrophus sp. SKADARSKE-3]|nr:Lipid-A-disaccharide synthase [Syntrophus sp. SKADARSKE-3]
MSDASKRIMIVAGEASGDLHGAHLVRAMLEHDPSLTFYGVGGKRLEEAGVTLVAHAADMAVVGLTEVVSKLGMILGVMGKLKASFITHKPDLIILIDYPDFNLPMAKAAKKKGIKVFYYISPQVWAWRKGRVRKIRKVVDKMAVILPFEEDFYRQAHVDVAYVGHPLLDAVRTRYSRDEAQRQFGLRAEGKTIGLLPGSRQSEVVKLLPIMLGAAAIIKERLPDVQFVLPLAETLERDFVARMIDAGPVNVKIIEDAIYDVIAVSDMVIVASGTATLETGLLMTPMLIVYKISPLSYLLGRLFISVSHIGLVNIIAGKTVVPEYIQGDATPERLAAYLLETITDKRRMTAIKSDLSEIKNKLGEPGAAKRAAALAYGML